MASWTRLFVSLNLAAYRLTRGWVGGKMAGQTVLLLTTLGRRSGKLHTIPINYYLDQERYVIVASNWGSDHQPAWYINLRSDPHATLQVKDKIIKPRNYYDVSGGPVFIIKNGIVLDVNFNAQNLEVGAFSLLKWVCFRLHKTYNEHERKFIIM